MTSSGWTIRGCDRRENLLGRRWGNEEPRERVRLYQGCVNTISPTHRSFLFPHVLHVFADGSPSTPNEPSPFPSTQSWNEVCSQWLCLPRSCCLFVQNYGLLADSFEVCCVNVVRRSSQFHHQRAPLYGQNGKELHQDPSFNFKLAHVGLDQFL